MTPGWGTIKQLMHTGTLQEQLEMSLIGHLARALTRILKTGVQDSHLAKSRSPTGKSGSPTLKKLGVPPICAYHISFPF